MLRTFILSAAFLFGLHNSSALHAQSPTEIDALNYYVEFINSSSHGLGIAMLVADNINCIVNAEHGDPCDNVVPITVEDIPSNLFDRPDDNSGFYTMAPLELTKIAQKESAVLKPKLAKSLNEKLNEAVGILNKINDQLYASDALMRKSKLKKKKQAEMVLESLVPIEEGFKAFKKLKREMIDLIIIDYPQPEAKIYPVLLQYRNATTALMEGLENQNLTEDDKRFEDFKLVRSNVLETFKTLKAAIGKTYPVFEEQIHGFETKSDMFLNLIKGGMIKKEEIGSKALLNKCNQISKLTINQTGPGYTVIFKEILRFLKFKAINFDEHIVQYKVEYPEW